MSAPPTQTAECPKCCRKISFWDVATALYPVWVKCKGCGAKLIGDRLIKTQGVVIPIIAAGLGVAIALRPEWDVGSYTLVTIGLLFTYAMVLVTVRHGRYSLKGVVRDASEESDNNEARLQD
jgi:prepilin signal peptidase PulO-like enzyme (type II secretory pathway)